MFNRQVLYESLLRKIASFKFKTARLDQAIAPFFDAEFAHFALQGAGV